MSDKAPNGSKHSYPGKEVVLMDDGQNGHGKRSVYVETIDQPGRSDGNAGLLDIWHLLRGHLGLIGAIGVLGALAGALFTLYETPQFRARTTVEVQPPATTAMGFTSGQAGEADSTETYIRTQTKILLSETLRDRVIAKLTATNRLSSYSPPDKLSSLRRMLRLSSPQPRAKGGPGRVPPFDFKVTSDTTHIVELSCDSADPRFAADYVNTVAEEFTQMQLETRWDASKRTTAWLNDQMAEMKQKVEDGEAKLRDNALSSGIMITDGTDAIPEDKLKQIQTELSAAVGERIRFQSIYEIAGKSPSAVDNERLNGYQTELAKLRQQLAEFRSIYTEEHYQVKRVKAQIADLEATLTREQNGAINRIRNEYLTAQRQEDLLKDAYASQSKIVLDHASRYAAYDILKREVDTDRALYSALLQKVRESGVTSAFSINNVHVVDRASVPKSPYRPSMNINVAGGLLGALVLGIGLVILGDQVNRSLKSPGETTAHLRVPELGVIPAYVASSSVQSNGAPKMLGLEQNGKKPVDLVELVMRNDAQSLVAESFRNVLTSILLSDSAEDRPKVIVMTAAGRQAGKSSSVSNLALALAEIGQKVLVIDADLRRPKQHLIFDTSNSWGLTDILQERMPLKDCPLEVIARSLESPGLYLLPSGPSCANVSSLLYSNRLSELLQRVRREFDTVLIDTPPVLMVADARVVGRLADASILVIRAGETTRDMAFQAKQRLVDDGIVVLGTILNQWRLKSRVPYSNYNYATNKT
ncbi:MAG: polysaccharide biosynthesis tyrosine autokinase [Bryobacteraceae bacterium]|jgi:capsular exopolysaccharide synthesis family protein